jgi:hypothetical protein
LTTHDEIRRIAMQLPGVAENPDGFGFRVPCNGKQNAFCHLWRERIDPKKPKVPNQGVLVVCVRNLTEKDILVGSAGDKYFTEPHYDGYAAVLVRLANIDADELEDLIIEGWKSVASASLLAEFEKNFHG